MNIRVNDKRRPFRIVKGKHGWSVIDRRFLNNCVIHAGPTQQDCIRFLYR